MKDGVRIVNCSRGGVIDEKALYGAIKEKKVAGCALDVFEKEPPADNPLLELDELIATPHLGASTQEAQTNVSLQIARQIKRALIENVAENAVNFPCIAPEILKEIQPYITLAEKLGRFQAQMADGNIERLNIAYGGDIADYDTQPFTLSLLKGLLEPTFTGAVNYVNSMFIAQERGIKIAETKSRNVEDFANLIKLEVETNKDRSSAAGTLFSKKDLRIIRINDYHVDASPEGRLLLCENYDKPGAVAHISAVLMDAGINIADMTVGRKEIGGKAVILLNIDGAVSEEVLKKIKSNPIIIQARLLEL
jgi:D-3-phosphoglycerate dehydrogenase